MLPYDHGTVVVEACSACAGLWFDPDALARLLRSDDTVLEEVEGTHVPHHGRAEAPSVLSCPQCVCVMEHYRYQYTSMVFLDGCPQCGGVFVRDNELHDLVQWRHRDSSREDRSAAIAGTLAAADAEMVESIRRAQSLTRLSRVLSMRWSGGPGLFAWSTQDVFQPEIKLPPPPHVRHD